MTATVMPDRRAVGSVLLLAFLLYLPAVGNGFALDDAPIARSSPAGAPSERDEMIARRPGEDWGAYIGKFFCHHYWHDESNNDGLYRPIVVLSYGLVYQLIGRHLEHEAGPQHLVNVLVHVWAVWLCIRLLAMAGAPRFVSLLTGLLFAVHAVHSEVVAGIVGRADMFAFCFGAIAVLWLVGTARLRYLWAGLTLTLAFGSKENALVWVPFYVCLALTRKWQSDPGGDPVAPLRPRALIGPLLAIGVPLALWFLGRHAAFDGDPPLDLPADWSSNPLAYVSLLERWMTATKVWAYGLWLCVAPFRLSCLYSPVVFDIVRSPSDAWFLASAGVLLCWLLAGIRFARRAPLFFLATATFFGFSFVTSNLPVLIGTILGERLYYVPSLGVCMLVALSWERLGRRWRPWFLIAISLWCGANMVVAVHRTQLWKDSETLFFHDARVLPDSVDLQRKCAQVLVDRRTDAAFAAALAHLDRALELYPDYVHAHRLKGEIHKHQGRWRQAIAAYQGALDADYPEPPGAECIALLSIGDCNIALAKAARSTGTGDTDPSATALTRLALAAYEKVLDLPAFGESHRNAYLKIFSHSDKLLPSEKIAAFYQRAYPAALHLEDRDLMLLLGNAAYKAGLPAATVFDPLRYVFANTPESERNEDFWLAHLFYADALVELGDPQSARRVFELLLGRPEIPDPTKAEIRQRLRADERLQK